MENISVNLRIVEGDLLEQPVEAIVNPWNRNWIPWWLLLPQGVSGAIKRQAGLQPFREIGRMGSIPLGQAVVTSAGRLPYRGIIHVAGINLWWRSSVWSVQESVRNAVRVANELGYQSIAMPLIGAGSGGGNPDKILQVIVATLKGLEFSGEVVIVRYRPRR